MAAPFRHARNCQLKSFTARFPWQSPFACDSLRLVALCRCRRLLLFFFSLSSISFLSLSAVFVSSFSLGIIGSRKGILDQIQKAAIPGAAAAAAAPSPCRHSLSLLIDRSVTVIESAAAAVRLLLLLFSFYAPNPILIPLTILVSVHFIFREPDPARRLHRTPTTA